jgi:cobalt-precorrin-5B (C1)-methyltransferase
MATPRKRRLRTGFTTGTAAAAAAKGALIHILTRARPTKVTVMLLTGDPITIPVYSCMSTGSQGAVCTVIKDAGDDPDITHKAEIGAIVSLLKPSTLENSAQPVKICGGQGVGMVTKPGLDVAPGEPAINPGPRRMITRSIMDVLAQHQIRSSINVEVFVPKGEALAEKTLNARLGILGGISILGTTGVVKPMSHQAYTATIESAMSVAKASGLTHLVLTTGRRSERYAEAVFVLLPEEAFVQVGDYFKMSLEAAAHKGFKSITLAVFFGKAVKMACGVPHTHAAKSRLSLQKLAEWAYQTTGNKSVSEDISGANTARHAFEMLHAQYPSVIADVGRRIKRAAKGYTGPAVRIQVIIFSYDGSVTYDSEGG